jgi:hypothetical protein
MREEITIPPIISDGTYRILKTMVEEDDKTTFVLMNDGYGEILTLYSWGEAEKLVDMLNVNSDSGWEYSIIRVGE